MLVKSQNFVLEVMDGDQCHNTNAEVKDGDGPSPITYGLLG
jgi:hypothetical protein